MCLCFNHFASAVPGNPPQNVTVEMVSSTSLHVKWKPPPSDRPSGEITYYKLFVVQDGLPESEAIVITIRDSRTSMIVDELRPWTNYSLWVLAGTHVGDGPASEPVTACTGEDGTCLKILVMKVSLYLVYHWLVWRKSMNIHFVSMTWLMWFRYTKLICDKQRISPYSSVVLNTYQS